MSKDERYTPEDLVRRVRDTLGGIDLDPMSCPEANTVVRAKCFYTKEMNGLSLRWLADSVYLNPPGSLRLEAHRKFAEEYEGKHSDWGLRHFYSGCVCLYDWDHSTEWFKVIADLSPIYALLRKRTKFSGKDVGRSQAFAFVGAGYNQVKKYWGDIAFIMSP